MIFELEKTRVAVIGLGYVGLPLAVEFGRVMPTLGYDLNAERIAELEGGKDHTLEVTSEDLEAAEQLSYTADPRRISECNVFVITVPTPIDQAKRPDLSPLMGASKAVGEQMKKGSVVIYESTVYPGATEDECVPVLEAASGLEFNKDFFVGYSPERINPGDHVHRLTTIVKVTSGSTPDAASFVDKLYAKIITAGTFPASSIRVAEAAKVIENTQRDVNIALVNELALIFERMGIDTLEVLEAAGTKWNFLPFRPGLVGGHCIGVDPYYLTHKAQEVGHHPAIILAGRRINDGMGEYVAGRVFRLMASHGVNVVGAKTLVLGLTFKENCPDLRNTRVVDIIAEMEAYNADIHVYDPWVDRVEAEREYAVTLVDEPEEGVYDAIIVAVAHQQFAELGPEGVRKFGREGAVLFDVKSLFDRDSVDGRL